MKKLTMEQKAKRYEYIEEALLRYLDQRIEDKKSEYEDEKYPCTAVVDEWLDSVDYSSDVVPHDIYLLLEQMITEYFPNHSSRFETAWGEEDKNKLLKERDEFLHEIGGTHGYNV